ncbi:chloride channel protein [Micromonospora sp. WMMD980]|uniref:chloride channel protein n=1 Tax=Micromonospora sp. WMMD980 TaxID=3016088 RepID=UPI0024178C86|nr:chloride channel protein [Micromonospora sp. WMMD980]MDG4802380.1 chloride channel protein [Micromonospora sp. WMMD980]
MSGSGGPGGLRLWVPLATLTGALAGAAAAAFAELLHLANELLLRGVAGHAVPGVVGEGGPREASGFPYPLVVPLLVAAGAFVATALVLRVAPETSGHGTDAAIHAAHFDPTGMRARVPAVKMVASAVLIGSGGSGGSEGPTAQITAALASVVARRFRLTYQQARTTVAMGLAAGVGAIFRSPLGGALLGAELLYRADVAPGVVVPALLASAVSFLVFGLIHGFDPLFGTVAGTGWEHPAQWLVVPLLGLLAGLLGRLYASVFYASAGFFSSARMRRLPRVLRPTLAGLVVGSIGLVVPGVLGTGYGTAQRALDPQAVLSTSVWLLLAIPLVKIASTSLSVGSGGSGGIFGPGLVIGATAGAAVWRLLEPLGIAPDSPAPYVIIGMAACLGSIAHAPLALIVMSAETTGNLSLLFPTMLATGIACLVVGDRTLYRSQLRDRAADPDEPRPGASPARGEGLSGPSVVGPRLPASGPPADRPGRPGRSRERSRRTGRSIRPGQRAAAPVPRRWTAQLYPPAGRTGKITGGAGAPAGRAGEPAAGTEGSRGRVGDPPDRQKKPTGDVGELAGRQQ